MPSVRKSQADGSFSSCLAGLAHTHTFFHTRFVSKETHYSPYSGAQLKTGIHGTVDSEITSPDPRPGPRSNLARTVSECLVERERERVHNTDLAGGGMVKS